MITKALIIAAGRGSRLGEKTEKSPKPLVKLFGLPLIERIMQTAATAGINEFFIVVGYKKEEIIDYFNKKPLPFTITWIENEEWEKSNGVSVLKAREFLKNDNFLLMMSDHIFEAKTVQALASSDLLLKKSDLVLATDSLYMTKEGIDLDDATKIYEEKGIIIDIGKELKTFNAVDTGLFLCSPVIFTELKKFYNKNSNCSLTEGNRALAGKKRFLAFDIGKNLWQDIDTEEDLKVAQKKILGMDH